VERAGRPGFEELYELHYRRAVRFARLITGGRDYEDLAQEGFIRAFRRWDPNSPSEAFWSWLQTTMLRLHLNGLRRVAAEARAYVRRGPDVESEDQPRHGELFDALRSLSPRQRAAIVLRYYEDLPEAKVAQALGCKLGTAKALLNQARRKLRMIVEETNLDTY
jgi:RNA polymerase sigma factor (sigma-70 family)